MTPKPKDIAKRRQILEWMGGLERSTKEIQQGIGSPTSTTRQVLMYMQAEGLLTSRRHGLQTMWRPTGKEINEAEVLNASSPFCRRDDCLLAQVWR